MKDSPCIDFDVGGNATFTLKPLCGISFLVLTQCLLQPARATIERNYGSNLPPQVRVLQPTNNADYVPGQTITCAVDAFDPDGKISAVEIYEVTAAATNLLGRLRSEPFLWRTNELPLGTHQMFARAVDDAQNQSDSQLIDIHVIPEMTYSILDQDLLYSMGYLPLPDKFFVAQTFVPEINGWLQKVQALLYPSTPMMIWYPVTVAVLDAPNGIPGTNVLASATFPVACLTNGVSWYSLEFTNPPLLMQKSPYALMYSSEGTGSGMHIGISWDSYTRGRLWQLHSSPTNSYWGPVDYYSEHQTDLEAGFTTFMIPSTPLLRITHPMEGDRLKLGVEASLGAQALVTLGKVARVEFYCDDNLLGSLAYDPPQVAPSAIFAGWSNLVSGIHVIRAKAITESGTVQDAPAVTVTTVAPNLPPTFSIGSDLVLYESGASNNPSVYSVTNWAGNISAGAPWETNQVVRFVVVADNPSLFAEQPTVDSLGTLRFTLAEHTPGKTALSVVLNDDGGKEFGGSDMSESQQFSVEVLPVNDPPVIDLGILSETWVLEDFGPQVYWTRFGPGPINDPTEAGQMITSITLSNDAPQLFSFGPAVLADGYIAFALAPDANGVAHITIRVQDNGGTENGGCDVSWASGVIYIRSMNDSPSFTPGPDIVVNEDAGFQRIAWVTNIVNGPPDEQGQPVNFFTWVDRPDLFSICPSIDPDGFLTFEFKPNSNGIANVDVELYDANEMGECAYSPIYRLHITSWPIYDPPELHFSTPTNGAVFQEGQSIQLTAYVHYVESRLTNLEFFASGLQPLKLAQVTGSPYIYRWSNAPVGAHSLYMLGTDNVGETVSSVPVSFYVNARPAVSLVSPVNGSVFTNNAGLTLSAEASDSDGTINKVIFHAVLTNSPWTNHFVATASNAPFSICWIPAVPGVYSIWAEAVDDLEGRMTSSKTGIVICHSPVLSEPHGLTLVPDGSAWRYVAADSFAPDNWSSKNYDDSSWLFGSAQFGVGDNDEITRLSPTAGAYYFRTRFFISNSTLFTSLKMSVLRDDGIIAYLNGREVLRDNMPYGYTWPRTYASSNVTGEAESQFYDRTINANWLTNGWNSIAVELHQYPAESDLSFDLALFGLYPAILMGAPVLQSDGSFSLEFPTTLQRSYVLERSDDLKTWDPCTAVIEGTGQTFKFCDSNFPLPPSRFYRVRLQQ